MIKKSHVSVNVTIRKNWLIPSEGVIEEHNRNREQVRADYIACKFEQLLKQYIEDKDLL